MDTAYRAFISYSHRDTAWGNWLHKVLESYRVPGRLVGSEGRDGPVPARLFPIFRDREELPTSDDLSTLINGALTRSAYLIVICSPNSARSRWVNEEILAFKRMGKENRILAIIVDGEPNAADKPGGGADQECFPPALRFKLGADGTLSDQPAEPIAADAREHGDGRENARLKLIAGLLGVGFDTLKQRDLEAARRRARIYQAVAGVMALLLVVSVFAGWSAYRNGQEARRQGGIALEQRNAARRSAKEAVQQRNNAVQSQQEAERQRGYAENSAREAKSQRDAAVKSRDQALIQQSKYYAARGRELLAAGDVQRALAAAALGLPRPGAQRPFVDEALDVAHTAHTLDDEVGLFTGHEGSVRAVTFSPEGSRLYTASEDGSIRVWDTGSGTQIKVLATTPYTLSHGISAIAISPDGKRLAANSFPGVVLLDASSGKQLFNYRITSPAMAFSPDGKYLALEGRDHAVILVQVDGGKQVAEFKGHTQLVSAIAFSPDGRRLASASFDKTGRLWDMAAGRQIAVLAGHADVLYSVAFSADGKHLLTTGGKTARVWDGLTGAQIASTDSEGEYISDPITRKVTQTPGNHTTMFSAGLFLPTENTTILAAKDGTLRSWNYNYGAEELIYANTDNSVNALALAGDGATFAVAGFKPSVTFGSLDGPPVLPLVPDMQDWLSAMEAQSFIPIDDAMLGDLGLVTMDDHRHKGPVDLASWQACDEEAASPADPDHVGTGVYFSQLMLAPESGCNPAKAPAKIRPRILYQRGRLQEHAGQFALARKSFEAALAGQYRAASLSLGGLLADPEEGKPDLPAAIRYLTMAWDRGVPAAASSLGDLYAHGVREPDGKGYLLAPDATKAAEWYRRGAGAGDARCMAGLAQAADAEAAANPDVPALMKAFRYYAAAVERARAQSLPSQGWTSWIIRRATLARLLARKGQIAEVGRALQAIRAQHGIIH